MARVTLENLYKIYPNGFVSVEDVSLIINDGEFFTFYGPHGCGKSAILRMIGGLEEITSGKVFFDEDLINDMLPPNRPLAMAFQNYVLYSHFNVYDNISLGLRLRNIPKQIIEDRVNDATDFLGIPKILSEKVKTLSPAARQKVALSRALVCRPAVLLVDEDFAQQDPNCRKDMITDIRKINKQLGITILYVTNDYQEAISVGDRVAFMEEGKIIKIESTTDQQMTTSIYRRFL